MAFKTDLQVLMIYLIMSFYFLGFFLSLMKWEKAGERCFFMGFISACVAYGYRWYCVGHWPLQNLFEVFLTLGLLIFPISVFCGKYLNAKSNAADMFLGIVVLFPAGFVFSPEPRQLPPSLQSWLFAPHVGFYMLSYVLMGKATFQALFQLAARSDPAKSSTHELATYHMVRAGFPFMTIGLILACWWARVAWGDFWGWDPKELWSLASWLVFVGYFHFRYIFGQKQKQANSIIVIIGTAAIILTLLWVNLSKLFPGIHSYAS